MNAKELQARLMSIFKVKHVQFVGPRMVALGHFQVCGRCGGDGRYSYCQMYGDRCFGCGGSGKVSVKLNKKLVDEVEQEVAAGKLEPWLKAQRLRAKFKGYHDQLFKIWGMHPLNVEAKEKRIALHLSDDPHWLPLLAVNMKMAKLSDELGTMATLVRYGRWEGRQCFPLSDNEVLVNAARAEGILKEARDLCVVEAGV